MTNFVHRILAGCCLLHPFIVFILWVQMIRDSSMLVSGEAWLIMAWLWLFWPLALCMCSPRSWRVTGIPVLIGIVMLAPCIPFVLAFTSWTIYGFAP
jgi:hypothetical protein